MNRRYSPDALPITTTGWKRNDQARGKPFQLIVSVGGLTRSDGRMTEIIKFHGDFDDDGSIVLTGMVFTESSYFRRMSFENPLDLRLRSDSLARPLLFLGYSLHDMNMRLSALVTAADLGELRVG